jgi:hypothetical protein
MSDNTFDMIMKIYESARKRAEPDKRKMLGHQALSCQHDVKILRAIFVS